MAYVLSKARSRYFSFHAHDDWYGCADYLEKLYEKVISDGQIGLVFSRNKIYREDPKRTQLVKEQRIDVCNIRSRYDLNRVVSSLGMMPFYGLYNLGVVKELSDWLGGQKDWCYFNEGPVMHYVYSKYDCAYVDDVFFCYFIHGKESSKDQKSFNFIKDFINYHLKTTRIYLSADYPFHQRINILSSLTLAHLKYAFVLTNYSIKQFFRRLPNLHKKGRTYFFKRRL